MQWLPIAWLTGLAAFSLLLAARFAYWRSRVLLWRSRWLLLSLAGIFLFFTPGEYLPGMAGKLGLTFEGMEQAGVQLGRLLAMLASLALLHERVGTQGLLGGLYWLMGPMPWRKMTVVRLMLVLESVEQKQSVSWREWLAPGSADTRMPEQYRLALPKLQLRDMALMGATLAAVLAVASR
jgi:hypothetical protein